MTNGPLIHCHVRVILVASLSARLELRIQTLVDANRRTSGNLRLHEFRRLALHASRRLGNRVPNRAYLLLSLPHRARYLLSGLLRTLNRLLRALDNLHAHVLRLLRTLVDDARERRVLPL